MSVDSVATAIAPPSDGVADVTLTRFILYFLHLGATAFGGPIALTASMQKTLVEERGWISPEDFRDGLALAQLAPGPLAAQVAIYLGYVRGGVAGATLAGLAFVAPSLLIVWAISILYVRFGGLPWIAAAFYGVGACVIGIIIRSAMRLAATTLSRRVDLWAIFLLLAITTAVTEREPVSLVILGGLIVLLPALRPKRVMAVATPLIIEIFWFFTKAGAFVFGSGLAIVPFLYGGVVQEYGWLNEQQFVDAVAVAMVTPGPVVITVAFIGYLTAGNAGLLAASAGVFLPVWLFVILPARWFRTHRDHPLINAFVIGVTAAATGAIAGASIVLARRAIFDVPTLLIAATTGLVLQRWRISELWLIGASAAAGVLLRGL